LKLNTHAWGKRPFDVALSIILLLVSSPILMIGYICSGFSLKRIPRLGRGLVIFDELSFDTNKRLGGRVLKCLHLQRIPVLLNIVKGDMSFVGPLPKSPTDFSTQDPAFHDRYSVPPGLISLWWIRRRANIDYETELMTDKEYVANYGLKSDIGICLRAIPAVLYGDKVSATADKVTLLGITFDNLDMSQAIDKILEWLHSETSKQVCFVNADCVNIAYRDETYLKVLESADLCLADGIGLKLAGKLLSQEITQNLCGTDMFPRLCQSISGTDVTLFLLGARPEAVEGLHKWIIEQYPEVQVCGCQHGYFKPEEEKEIVLRIKDSGVLLLLVAFGVPKQDIWIRENLKQTGVRVAMGVGGLFDFYSGAIPRAPLWMREIGMEWLYRLIQEPGRMWKRYLVGNVVFMWRVFKSKFFPENR
jgi:N-acetylglucosaminyldiphosphoundecaprenol N-acetyl-beta-D-mannosaminyltransferase